MKPRLIKSISKVIRKDSYAINISNLRKTNLWFSVNRYSAYEFCIPKASIVVYGKSCIRPVHSGLYNLILNSNSSFDVVST